MSKKKLWATQDAQGAALVRHESHTKVRQHIWTEVGNWRAGTRSSAQMKVYVDERDGYGWCLYERIDLQDFVSAVPTGEGARVE